MEIHKYQENENIDDALKNGEPLLAVISYDGKHAYVGHIDECVEHHILLAKSGQKSTDIDKYFRIIFDTSSADWTFVAPVGYKNIVDKEKRIATFYNDGFKIISKFLTNLGLPLIDIKIPTRYRRHINYLNAA